MRRTGRCAGRACRRPDKFWLAAVALLALSVFLMVAPLCLDAFQCTSFVGMPSLGLGPQPMWVRPIACAFGSLITFLGVGFAGLVVATAWTVHARQRRLAAVALALTLAGAGWLFLAIGGPDLVRRILSHVTRLL